MHILYGHVLSDRYEINQFSAAPLKLIDLSLDIYLFICLKTS